MSRKKKILTVGVVVIIIILAVMIVPRFLKPKVEPVPEVPPVVDVQNPQVYTIELDSELIGVIEPDNIVYVYPKGAGELTSVHVKTGDQVAAGQVLCVIDTKQVESSRISMETAKVSMEQAQDALSRLAPLHAAGAVSEQDYQNAVDGAKMSKLQYENAKLGYSIQLENSQVTAPISGKVESFDVEVHDVVSPQTQVCVISGEGNKAVTFYVSERVVDGLRLGGEVRVEKNGKEYSAAVSEISSMIDSSNGLFKVKASVSGGDALATGSSVKLYVASQKAENALTVPVDAVYYENEIPYVYTYADGVVKKNQVEVGLSDTDYIEIKSGLNAADQVIVTWSSEFYEGSRVTLAGESPAAPETVSEDTAESTAAAE